MSEQSTEAQDTPEASEQESWEELEKIDDYSIESDELAAEIEVINGKPNMSLAGYAALANEEGIEVDQCTYEEKPETKGVLVIVSGLNTQGKRRWASHLEPKSNEFQWAKAWSKAQRNLFKICLYGHWKIKEAFAIWESERKDPKTRKRQQSAPRNGQAAPANQKAKQTPTDTARKAFFAALGEQVDDLAKRGVSRDAFLETLKEILGVKSSKDITLAQWKETRAALKVKGYGKIVLKHHRESQRCRCQDESL